MKKKLLDSATSSKLWWKVSSGLLNKKNAGSAIPPLQTSDGKTVMDSKSKANLLSDTFNAKSQLKEYSVPFDENSVPFADFPIPDYVRIRTRDVEKLLKLLQPDTSTGPDEIPAMLLKMCCSTLSHPLCQLIRNIYDRGEWPNTWKLHWIIPIYKRSSPGNPRNYRGVHLTPIISKIAERLIGNPLIKFLENNGHWCDAQFAFRKGHSVMDALAYACNKWLLAFNLTEKVGVYCSDIAGAFDRVATHILLKKLHRKGVRDKMLKFLKGYLEPRNATVCVGGEFSELKGLLDTVFQGTVLGPALWNTFFDDISKIITHADLTEFIFCR